MKKLIPVLILVFISIFMFTACGDGAAVNAPEDQNPSQGTTDSNISGSDPVSEAPAGDSDTTSPDDSAGNDEPQIPTVFFFKMGDVVIDMNQNINDVVSKIGEPSGIFEAPSCAFDGIDRIFGYNNAGVQLYTYPIGDDDFIHTIGFTNDSARTAEGGIRLGASLQAVIDAYGDDYTIDTGMYKFTRGLTSLEFLVDDDMVIGITYGFKIEQ